MSMTFLKCYKPGRLHEQTPTWNAKPDGRWDCEVYDELLDSLGQDEDRFGDVDRVSRGVW
jgi:hypothetical protein